MDLITANSNIRTIVKRKHSNHTDTFQLVTVTDKFLFSKCVFVYNKIQDKKHFVRTIY